ncbi:MAG: hypothetical protein IPL53_21335 [Ignavibacteria bacterium]|nr:hypothetical protein [Ignavibacteria bacterium]
MTSTVNSFNQWEGYNSLSRIRCYVGYSLFDHISIIAGVSVSYYHRWLDNAVDVNPFYPVMKEWDAQNKLWPGVFVGIQF